MATPGTTARSRLRRPHVSRYVCSGQEALAEEAGEEAGEELLEELEESLELLDDEPPSLEALAAGTLAEDPARESVR